jgi:hypothetical protein
MDQTNVVTTFKMMRNTLPGSKARNKCNFYFNEYRDRKLIIKYLGQGYGMCLGFSIFKPFKKQRQFLFYILI